MGYISSGLQATPIGKQMMENCWNVIFGVNRICEVCVCVLQALVYDQPGQTLEIELFDEDPDEDDFLGR